MADKDDSGLSARLDLVRDYVEAVEQLAPVGALSWRTVEADFRLLAINSALRRQNESLRAEISLCEQGLGHLGVSFVRASLEDLMYLKFLIGLDAEVSQELFMALGTWDALRSLLAQRAYVGDDVMLKLWYTQEYLDRAEEKREQFKQRLKQLKKKHDWTGGLLPSGDWIADKVGERELYDYLHAATSRAVHFSAGEIMRRAWGNPEGEMVTDNEEFRIHLASFALDQLMRLHIQTTLATHDMREDAGIKAGAMEESKLLSIIERISALGRVPLVHAREYNLRPDGIG